MTNTTACWISTTLLITSLSASADTFRLDPDNYTSGTDLTHVMPQVTLSLAVSGDNQWVIDSWYISAQSDSFASTGNNVFGYLGSYTSLWDGRRLRMDFSSKISSVSIDFIGSTGNDAGELHIFDSNWHELGSAFVTPALAPHQVETMSLSSSTADIAHAVAYTQGGWFGRLANLQFTTAVPEPTPALFGATIVACLLRMRKSRKGKWSDGQRTRLSSDRVSLSSRTTDFGRGQS